MSGVTTTTPSRDAETSFGRTSVPVRSGVKSNTQVSRAIHRCHEQVSRAGVTSRCHEQVS